MEVATFNEWFRGLDARSRKAISIAGGSMFVNFLVLVPSTWVIPMPEPLPHFNCKAMGQWLVGFAFWTIATFLIVAAIKHKRGVLYRPAEEETGYGVAFSVVPAALASLSAASGFDAFILWCLSAWLPLLANEPDVAGFSLWISGTILCILASYLLVPGHRAE